jgi:hypothetical protein
LAKKRQKAYVLEVDDEKLGEDSTPFKLAKEARDLILTGRGHYARVYNQKTTKHSCDFRMRGHCPDVPVPAWWNDMEPHPQPLPGYADA